MVHIFNIVGWISLLAGWICYFNPPLLFVSIGLWCIGVLSFNAVFILQIKEKLRANNTNNSWNYRLVKTVREINGEKYTYYEIHEVYYDDDGNPDGMTVEPVRASEIEGANNFTDEECKEGVIKQLKMMLKDVKNQDIFVPPKKWPKDG